MTSATGRFLAVLFAGAALNASAQKADSNWVQTNRYMDEGHNLVIESRAADQKPGDGAQLRHVQYYRNKKPGDAIDTNDVPSVDIIDFTVNGPENTRFFRQYYYPADSAVNGLLLEIFHSEKLPLINPFKEKGMTLQMANTFAVAMVRRRREEQAKLNKLRIQ